MTFYFVFSCSCCFAFCKLAPVLSAAVRLCAAVAPNPFKELHHLTHYCSSLTASVWQDVMVNIILTHDVCWLIRRTIHLLFSSWTNANWPLKTGFMCKYNVIWIHAHTGHVHTVILTVCFCTIISRLFNSPQGAVKCHLTGWLFHNTAVLDPVLIFHVFIFTSSCSSCCTPEVSGLQFSQLLVLQQPGHHTWWVVHLQSPHTHFTHTAAELILRLWCFYISQQRANMQAVTLCVPGPRRPGRRGSETSSAGPRGSLRRRTRGPWR